LVKSTTISRNDRGTLLKRGLPRKHQADHARTHTHTEAWYPEKGKKGEVSITWLIRGRRRAEWRTHAAAQATMRAISSWL